MFERTTVWEFFIDEFYGELCKIEQTEFSYFSPLFAKSFAFRGRESKRGKSLAAVKGKTLAMRKLFNVKLI